MAEHDRTGYTCPGRGQARAAAVHATQHGQDSQVQRQRPGRGRPLADRGDAEQGGREVLAPDDDGVGGRAQQHQVQGEPATEGHPVAEGERHPASGQVGEHEPSDQEMAAGSPDPA